MLRKLISGGDTRKTRLHDEKGNFISLSRLFFHGPQAILSGVLRVLFGYRPKVPWISYSAVSVLKNHLNKSSRVLEFGSGMSTIWYANHARQVYAVEDHKAWYEKVQKLIKESKIENIDFFYADTEEDYAKFKHDDKEGFDLIIVDGSCRSKCIENATKLLRSGGILYLDNSDKHSTPAGGDTRIAEAHALNFAEQRQAKVTYFTDFVPTQFFVEQGMLIKLP